MKKSRIYRLIAQIGMIILVIHIIFQFFFGNIFGYESIMIWIPGILLFISCSLITTGYLLEQYEKNPKWWIAHNRLSFILMLLSFFIGIILLILGIKITYSNILFNISLLYFAVDCYYVSILIFYLRKKITE